MDKSVGKSLIRKMFLGWISMMILPIVLVLIFNYVQYGNFIKASGHGITTKLQVDELSPYEAVGRITNSIIITNPDAFLESDINTAYRHIEAVENLRLLVVIKKGDVVFSANSFHTRKGQDVVKTFESIKNITLPEFGSKQFQDNKLVLKETGYLMARQVDFYFSDGEEGSVFIFNKFVNVPMIIVKVVTENFLFIGIVTFIIMIIGMHKTFRYIIRPVIEIIDLTLEISKNKFTGRISSMPKDITLIKLKNAINNMAEKLELTQQNNLKLEMHRKEYIAAVSHDLKTPITAINMNVGALKDGLAKSPEKAEKYFNNILKKTNDINTMVKELSLYSDLENGIGDHKFEEVDIEWFVKDVIEETLYGIEDEFRDIRLINHLDRKVMKNIDTDKIKRYIMNVISNSIKYANAESLEIVITLEEVLGEMAIDTETPLRIVIEDNGIGVPQEKLDRIFDKFYRIDEARNQNQHGSGLGLAICKSIIEKHGGRISAESEFGKNFRIIAEI